MASILNECEGVTIHISAMLVLVCGITCTPCNFGFVAWLDAPLLQYSIASILKVCEEVAIIIIAVLVLVLLDVINPMQFYETWKQLVSFQFFVLVLQVDLNLRHYLGHVGWLDGVVPGNVKVCRHH
jgi:hypothetical protein